MPTDEENISRYETHAHGMQAGVALEMEKRPEPTTPKHLRVGINAAMADHGGLVTLLIEKGVFTKSEYLTAIADAMGREHTRYEEYISELLGGNIKLV